MTPARRNFDREDVVNACIAVGTLALSVLSFARHQPAAGIVMLVGSASMSSIVAYAVLKTRAAARQAELQAARAEWLRRGRTLRRHDAGPE